MPSAFPPSSSKPSSSTWNWSTKSRFPRFSSPRGPSAVSPFSLGLSSAFDLFMTSFIDQPREFPSPFCPEAPFSLSAVPRFSSGFHALASLLCSPALSPLYARFKSFCLALWTDLLHNRDFPAGTALLDRIDAFCQTTTTDLRTGFHVSTIEGTGDAELVGSLQQMIFNLIGGGLLRLIARENRGKERLLNTAIHVHQFLRPQHLEIPAEYVENPRFARAVEEFRSLFQCRSPRFMLRCLAETSKSLASLLREGCVDSRGDGLGADDFVPVFIFCVLRSDAEFLNAASVFMDRFRRASEMEMG